MTNTQQPTTTRTRRIRRPGIPMTQIKVTCSAPRMDPHFPGIRASKGREIWGAESTDGIWTYERSEEPGTPWVVTHQPTGHIEFFASLPKARRWTCSEHAISDICQVLTARRLYETGEESSDSLVALVALTVLAA